MNHAQEQIYLERIKALEMVYLERVKNLEGRLASRNEDIIVLHERLIEMGVEILRLRVAAGEVPEEAQP